MRRDAIVRLAVPGRELHHRQVGCEKFQRASQLLHARSVATDHREAYGSSLRLCRDGAGEIGDDQAALLSHEIAREIESQLEYPGQIKVTVIRESRAVEYAK